MAKLKVDRMGIFKYMLIGNNEKTDEVVFFNKGDEVHIDIKQLFDEDIRNNFILDEKEIKTFALKGEEL